MSGLGISSFAHFLNALSLKIANFKEWLWAIPSRRSLQKGGCEQIALIAL